jgi:ribonuclease Z
MSKLIILGSSNAIPTMECENTHMVIVGKEHTALVDCVSNPILRLEQARVDFNDLTDIIITHFHPDHISGLPLLLMDMWLMGRKKPLDIYGLHYTLDRVEGLMDLYSWADWPKCFPVAFHRLPLSEMVTVLNVSDFKIICSPVRHIIPTIGLRIEFNNSGKVLAYSSDTEPCEQVVHLAERANVLIHEASGASIGHSSASQAGEIAARAEVGMLYLIHYPSGRFAQNNLAEQAHTHYHGEVALATDFMTLDFSTNNK